MGKYHRQADVAAVSPTAVIAAVAVAVLVVVKAQYT